MGAAAWSFVLNRVQNDRDVGELKEVNEGKEGEIGEREGKEGGKDSWGIGANVKFCEDVFIVADEHMLRSCSGKDYASKISSPFSSTFPLSFREVTLAKDPRTEHINRSTRMPKTRNRKQAPRARAPTSR